MIAEDGSVLESREDGAFHTFETNPEVFKFSASACAHDLSEGEVFKHIASNDPDIVIQLGDMHYAGTEYMTSGLFQEAYHEVFKSGNQRRLYEN